MNPAQPSRAAQVRAKHVDHAPASPGHKTDALPHARSRKFSRDCGGKLRPIAATLQPYQVSTVFVEALARCEKRPIALEAERASSHPRANPFRLFVPLSGLRRSRVNAENFGGVHTQQASARGAADVKAEVVIQLQRVAVHHLHNFDGQRPNFAGHLLPRFRIHAAKAIQHRPHDGIINRRSSRQRRSLRALNGCNQQRNHHALTQVRQQEFHNYITHFGPLLSVAQAQHLAENSAL